MSVYPAHALYVGEIKQDQNVFREGIEWTVDGPILANHAFRSFAEDGNQPGATPFDKFGSWDGRVYLGVYPGAIVRFWVPVEGTIRTDKFGFAEPE